MSGSSGTAAPVERLDHVVVLVADLEQAIDDYRALFACHESWRAADPAAGVASGMFTFPALSFELLGAQGEGPLGDRIRKTLAAQGEGPASMVFETGDIEAARRLLERRGLAPEPIAPGSSTDLRCAGVRPGPGIRPGTDVRQWLRTRATGPHAAGLRLFVIETDRRSARLQLSTVCGPDPVVDLDQLVVQSADPDRSLALFGARLGLRLALDRAVAGAQLLYFRLGALTLEVAHRPGHGPPDGADRLWGFCWRVADVAAVRNRLGAAGFDVSPVRPGLKPGTSVATVRTRTHGCPTLLVGPG